MEIKKCPLCSNEYDASQHESCPFCDVPCGDITPDSATPDGSKKRKIGQGILIAVLSLLIVFFGLRLVYITSFLGAPNTIDAKSFGASELDGVYKDDTAGQYIVFKTEQIKAEPSSLSDASGEQKTYEGSFETGYTKEQIAEISALNFINTKGLGEGFIEFCTEKGYYGDAPFDFVRDSGLEADLAEFEQQSAIKEQIEQYLLEGFWNFEDGKIELYDQDGNYIYYMNVTNNGICVGGSDFFGKMRRNGHQNSQLVYEAPEQNYTQSITTYKDGRFIISSHSTDMPTQLSAGEYALCDGVLFLCMEGAIEKFHVTDFGITPFLFNK